MARHRVRRVRSFSSEGEPDMTPLIDCVFLLLIFFMVTTVFLQTKGLEVDMPADSQAEEEKKKDVNVAIDQFGKIQIGGQDVLREELKEKLGQAVKEANNENIIIQADGECAQKDVVYVVDSARQVGIEGIAFVQEEE
ncbi:MAG TPA: biopolymer transporter ExbD [Alteromonas macleodii]|nr:biopolymer transporter ExbD [Myxococcales bacterium]MEC7609942.1 biopolymer transporter ExbD [Verrucomicrobiota bacterium]HCS81445.1 biopolymer transporter ExbD [Alteromonas macleodii]|tara:strand:- start:839 stop:1252 length:414 start_codon:yes stop_codon:yes gene_type:complete